MPAWPQVYYTAGAKNDFAAGSTVELYKLANDIGEELLTRHADYNFNGKNITNLGQIVQDAWTPITPLNGWVNYGAVASVLQIRKGKDNLVHIRGLVKSGTMTNDTLLGSIPAAFRPQTVVFLPACFSNGASFGVGQARVDSTGSILIRGVTGNSYLSIDGVYAIDA